LSSTIVSGLDDAAVVRESVEQRVRHFLCHQASMLCPYVDRAISNVTITNQRHGLAGQCLEIVSLQSARRGRGHLRRIVLGPSRRSGTDRGTEFGGSFASVFAAFAFRGSASVFMAHVLHVAPLAELAIADHTGSH
jgi:hypothetical protein